VELGLRMRCEIMREFAPYVGISWECKVGRTADFARREGQDVDDLRAVVGVRFWF
jgi:copper resistance protein B